MAIQLSDPIENIPDLGLTHSVIPVENGRGHFAGAIPKQRWE